MEEEAVLCGGFAGDGAPVPRTPRTARRLGLLALAAGLSLAFFSVFLAVHSPAELLLTAKKMATLAAEGAQPPFTMRSDEDATQPRARLQELTYADSLEFHQPYVPPTDLYIFWGKSSFKGHGALGRVSSAQRVRKVSFCCILLLLLLLGTAQYRLNTRPAAVANRF